MSDILSTDVNKEYIGYRRSKCIKKDTWYNL